MAAWVLAFVALVALVAAVAALVFAVRADRAARSAALSAAREVSDGLRRHGAAMGELRDAVDALHREVGRLLARTDRDRYTQSQPPAAHQADASSR